MIYITVYGIDYTYTFAILDNEIIEYKINFRGFCY